MKTFIQMAGICVAILLAGCGGQKPVPVSIERKPAPDFELENLLSNKVNSNEFKGRWLIVNIWASWCPSCVREIPELIEIQRRMQKKLQVVGISIDDMDARGDVHSLTQRMKVNYPILFSSLPEMRSLFGVLNAIPTTFVISPDWELVNQHTGEITAEIIKRDFKSRLKEYKERKKNLKGKSNST